MAKKGNNNDIFKWVATFCIGGIAIYFLTRNNNNTNTSNNTNTGYYLPSPAPVYSEPTTTPTTTTPPTTSTTTTTTTPTTTTKYPQKIYDWVDQIVANVNAGAGAQPYADILLNIANENELATADAVAREVYNMSLAQIFNYIAKEILVLLISLAKGHSMKSKLPPVYPHWYNFLYDIASKK